MDDKLVFQSMLQEVEHMMHLPDNVEGIAPTEVRKRIEDEIMAWAPFHNLPCVVR